MLAEEDLQNIREIIEDVINKSEMEENFQMKDKIDKISKVIEETEKWRNERDTKKQELEQKSDLQGKIDFIVEERDKLRETIRKLKIVM